MNTFLMFSCYVSHVWGFTIQSLYKFLNIRNRSIFLFVINPPWFNAAANIRWKLKIINFPVWNHNFIRAPWCPVIHNSTPFWIIRILSSYFNERSQVWHPHKTEDRLVDLCILIFKFRRKMTTSKFIDVKNLFMVFHTLWVVM